ncbi:hypothetical protein [Liquorilactobacillus mali]|uniref:hypothetical protein n=1 Tax=Liquorilactobacillus mali TaxID=1618 RepID=UPI00030C862A|nr:hypothetical protein [Liquorilactobacillus mali]MDC7954038.1 hypothetical protein [Liquorilactobacillus mali]
MSLFWKDEIVLELLESKNVIITTHGNGTLWTLNGNRSFVYDVNEKLKISNKEKL